MSGSVKLPKTYGTICMIVSFILFALATCCVWGTFHFGNEGILLLFPLIPLFGFFVVTCIAVYDYFLKAGKHMEQDNRMKTRNHPIPEEDDDDDEYEEQEQLEEKPDISSLQDSAQLQTTYGILSLIAAFVIFAGVILLSLYLFSKDPLFLLFILFPGFLIFLLIYSFAFDACEHFMQAGMYIERSKE